MTQKIKIFQATYLYLACLLLIFLRLWQVCNQHPISWHVTLPIGASCQNPVYSVAFYTRCDDFQSAVQHYFLLDAPRPTDAYFAGLAAANLGEWQQAVTILDQADVPSNAFLQSRQVLYENGRIQSALFQAEIALRLQPIAGASSYPYNDLLTAANDYQNWGFVDTASRLLHLLAEQWSIETWEHWHYEVRAASLNGTNAEVLQALTQARRYFPQDRFFLNRQIGLLYQLDEFDKVLAVADEWQIYQPENAMPYYFKGLAWLREGEYGLAQDSFNIALSLVTESDQEVRILIGLGNLSRTQAALDQAIYYFEQALAIDPQNIDAWSNLDAIKKKK